MNWPNVYMYSPNPDSPPPSSPSHPSRLHRAPALGALLHVLNFHWSSILHMVMYTELFNSNTTLAFLTTPFSVWNGKSMSSLKGQKEKAKLKK